MKTTALMLLALAAAVMTGCRSGAADSPATDADADTDHGATFREINAEAFKHQGITILSDTQKRHIAQKTDDHTILSRVWKGSDEEFLIQRESRDLKRIDICRVDLATLTVTPVIEERFNPYLEPREPMWTAGPGSDLVH
jgi:hypothetical protein